MRTMPTLEMPRRLLLGPGPSNVHPRVLRAMSQPLVGHLDPVFLAVLDEVQEGLARLFGVTRGMTLPISAPGSAGMETCLGNLLEPGDAIVVGVNGVFGGRMCEVARRLGARVTRVDAEWGTPLDDEAVLTAIDRVQPRVVAFVHAETSTGVLQPVETLARAARETGAYTVLDCVTSLAGIPLALEHWGIDAAYSGTQKCLSVPPGLSPVHFSERALERIASRTIPVQSWFLDANLLAGYFGGDRVYHHTAPVSSILGLAEGLRLVLEEGMETRSLRHHGAAQALIEGLDGLGFSPLVAPQHRLPMLSSMRLPESVVDGEGGEAGFRRRLLDHYGIEVGGGLGDLAGKIWRIGLMGENARLINVEALLYALHKMIDG